jgi:hypothetical protein
VFAETSESLDPVTATGDEEFSAIPRSLQYTSLEPEQESIRWPKQEAMADNIVQITVSFLRVGALVSKITSYKIKFTKQFLKSTAN